MIENVFHDNKDSEQALFDALYEIMLTTPIDKITVDQIVKSAHISRAGFYRRYKDKYDLLNSGYERILENTLFTFQTGNTWKDSIYRIYSVIGEHWQFFNNAFHSEDCNSLRNYIFDRTLRLEKEILKDHGINPDEPLNTYRLIAYVSGGLAVTVRWVEDHAELPLDELIDVFTDNVPLPFKDCFL